MALRTCLSGGVRVRGPTNVLGLVTCQPLKPVTPILWPEPQALAGGAACSTLVKIVESGGTEMPAALGRGNSG